MLLMMLTLHLLIENLFTNGVCAHVNYLPADTENVSLAGL